MADPFTQRKVVLFQEITGGMLGLLIGAALLLLAVMLYVIFRKTSAVWQGGWKGGKRRGTVALLPLFLLLPVAMNGCATEGSGGAGYDIYNAAYRSQFENERYAVWFDWETETLLFENKETGGRRV